MRCTLLLVVFLSAAGLTACGGSRIEQSSPAAVVEVILEAARTGEYGGLAGVVDPAGGDADEIFAPEALPESHRLTLGTPRLINTLCDTALTACMVAKSSVSVPP